MNHMKVSLIKSAIRIIACIALCLSELKVATFYFNGKLISSLYIFALFFGLAEVLGIIEEIADKRKEQ